MGSFAFLNLRHSGTKYSINVFVKRIYGLKHKLGDQKSSFINFKIIYFCHFMANKLRFKAII